MDDFNDPFNSCGGGYSGVFDHGHWDNFSAPRFEPCYTPTCEPAIDPMAYVPGAILDPSHSNYAASLAVQQGLEAAHRAHEESLGFIQQQLVAGHQVEYVPQEVFYQLPPEQQETWRRQEVVRAHQEGRKVFHKKSAEGLYPSELVVTPVDPCESARLIRPPKGPSLAHRLWDDLKESLRERLIVALGGTYARP